MPETVVAAQKNVSRAGLTYPSQDFFYLVRITGGNHKSFGCGSFRTGDSGAVERKMDLSHYGSGEGILGWGSWVGQNNLTRNRPTDWTSGSSYFTRFR